MCKWKKFFFVKTITQSTSKMQKNAQMRLKSNIITYRLQKEILVVSKKKKKKTRTWQPSRPNASVRCIDPIYPVYGNSFSTPSQHIFSFFPIATLAVHGNGQQCYLGRIVGRIASIFCIHSYMHSSVQPVILHTAIFSLYMAIVIATWFSTLKVICIVTF